MLQCSVRNCLTSLEFVGLGRLWLDMVQTIRNEIPTIRKSFWNGLLSTIDNCDGTAHHHHFVSCVPRLFPLHCGCASPSLIAFVFPIGHHCRKGNCHHEEACYMLECQGCSVCPNWRGAEIMIHDDGQSVQESGGSGSSVGA